MFCLLVVLAKLSLLAKWLARKTPLKKPNCGEGIISIKPRPKSAHDYLGLLYCFIVLLCISVVSCPYMIYCPTVMARYSLFVLKVPLNPKQTNKQTSLNCSTFIFTAANVVTSNRLLVMMMSLYCISDLPETYFLYSSVSPHTFLGYCKTRIVLVPFISRISRPWQPRENNGSLIYILAAIC